MGYYMEQAETLPVGIRRITREQVNRALALLNDKDGDQDKAVHEARKSFKQIRAVQRLVRDQIGIAVYQRENACIRDAANSLAPLRDSFVQIRTLDRLIEHLHDDSPTLETANELRGTFVDRYNNIRRVILEGDTISTVVKELILFDKRIDSWTMENEDFSAIAPGISRVYRRGIRALADVNAHPLSAEYSHEWRKRVKYLWYHIRILQPCAPEHLGKVEQELHQLSEYLGDAHDYAVLYDLAAGNYLVQSAGGHKLLALIDYYRAQLEQPALEIGNRIYAQPLEDFVNQIQNYWCAWKTST